MSRREQDVVVRVLRREVHGAPRRLQEAESDELFVVVPADRLDRCWCIRPLCVAFFGVAAWEPSGLDERSSSTGRRNLLRTAGADPRLACDQIAGDPAEPPANDVALVATNPARNERDLQVRPGLSVQPEPVETVGIEPTSAIACKAASTSVSGALCLALRSPSPAGSRRASLPEVFPVRQRRSSPGEPASDSAGSRRRLRGPSSLT